MTRPWWRVPRAPACARAVAAVLAGYACLAGCGRSSRQHAGGPHGEPAAGAGGSGQDAGRGGESATGAGSPTAGASSQGGGDGGRAVGGNSAGAVSGSAGSSAGGGGTSGTANGGRSAAGGFAGDVLGTAGDAAAGAGGEHDCQDLCSPGAPACCTNELSCVSHVAGCRFDVLVGRVGTAYEYSELEAKVAALSGEVAFTLMDTDIEWASAEPPLASRFELHLTREASSAHRDALTSFEADTQAFRFVCDDETLFTGIFYLIYGAAALQIPVLHVDDVENDALVLKLGAWQGAWLFSTSGETSELRARIDRPELRAMFCARSALTVLDPL